MMNDGIMATPEEPHRSAPESDTIRAAAARASGISDRLLTLAQVAEIMNTSPRMARRLVEERRIEHLRIGRHIRISAAALRSFLEAGKVEAGT